MENLVVRALRGIAVMAFKSVMRKTKCREQFLIYCESTSLVPSDLENWREHAKISQDGINSLNSTRCQLIFMRSYLIGGRQVDESSITRFCSILKLRRALACGGRRLHTIHVLLVAYKLRIIAFISFIELLSRNEASAHSHQLTTSQLDRMSVALDSFACYLSASRWFHSDISK